MPSQSIQRIVAMAMQLRQERPKTNSPLPKQTKTNNPLPKQTIVEPQTSSQTNIVQESRKRKGELPHLVKRKRPNLLPHRQAPAFSFATPSPVSLVEISLPSGRAWDTNFS